MDDLRIVAAFPSVPPATPFPFSPLAQWLLGASALLQGGIGAGGAVATPPGCARTGGEAVSAWRSSLSADAGDICFSPRPVREFSSSYAIV
jgi:hypothetical protein